MMSREMRSNIRNLYADIFWYGVLAGSTLAFIGVYAARLGATSFQVSLLTAGPAAVNLLFSLPFGRWMEKRSYIRVSFWSAFWQRLGYFLLILLPWLLTPLQETWAMVLVILVISMPGTLLAIGFNALLAQVVPPEQRGTVVGKRNALMALSLGSTALLCGQLLDHVAFPLNYQVLFLIGGLGAALSTYYLSRITSLGREPSGVFLPSQGKTLSTFKQFFVRIARSINPRKMFSGKPLLRLDLLHGSFGRFMLAYLLFYAFQYYAIPLFPIFWVRSLHLADGEIGLGNALFYLTMLLSSLGLGWVSDHWGHRKVLVFGSLTYGIYPLLNALAKDATLFWVASVLGGIIWGISSGGLLNRLMERVPEHDSPAHMAIHNLALNLGILWGSLNGPLLAGWLGLREALFIAAGLRFLGGVLLLIWG